MNSKGEKLELEAEAEAEAEAQEEKEQTEPKDEMDEKLEPETDTAMAEKDLPLSSRKEPSVDGDRRQTMKIPTNFNEMLLFNASVMGFGDSLWMKIVLTKFDDMVKNVANFSRLQAGSVHEQVESERRRVKLPQSQVRVKATCRTTALGRKEVSVQDASHGTHVSPPACCRTCALRIGGLASPHLPAK